MKANEMETKWGLATATWVECRLKDEQRKTTPFYNKKGATFLFDNIRVAEVGNSVEEAVYVYHKLQGRNKSRDVIVHHPSGTKFMIGFNYNH